MLDNCFGVLSYAVLRLQRYVLVKVLAAGRRLQVADFHLATCILRHATGAFTPES
jgi:hypothetical protein